MSKTTKQLKHLFNLTMGIFIAGFIFTIGALMAIKFFLRVSNLL